MTATAVQPARPAGRRGLGFWIVASAFTTIVALTSVPTPLWTLFARRDRFSSLTVSLVFAVYALAIALSLFLAGHLSAWYCSRRVLSRRWRGEGLVLAERGGSTLELRPTR